MGGNNQRPDEDGYNQNGASQNGYSQNGANQNGCSQNGYGQNGYNNNYNQNGYSGYNQNGYGNNGYSQNGYNNGYNNGYGGYNNYNQSGYNNGYNGGYGGYNRGGYNYNPNGYNPNGYNQNGGRYQNYNYDPGFSYGKKPSKFISREVWYREKKNLKSLSALSSLSILLYIFLSGALTAFLQFLLSAVTNGSFDFYDAVNNDAEFSYLFQTIYSIFVVGGPFFLLGYIYNKTGRGIVGSMPLGKPKNAKYLPIIILGAFGVCLAGNIVTSYIDVFIEWATGIELTTPELPSTPKTFWGIFLNFLCTAIVPALVEEMALRGVVMQPLRRYGDMFAIVCSSLIFGFMHCNLTQIPFAVMAGIAIGYADVATDSLWTGVIIHFLNNGFSTLVSIIYEFYGDSLQYNLCNVAFFAFIIIGGLSVFLYFKKFGKSAVKESPFVNAGKRYMPQMNPLSERVSEGAVYKTYLLTVPMVLAFIAVCYETLMTFIMQ